MDKKCNRFLFLLSSLRNFAIKTNWFVRRRDTLVRYVTLVISFSHLWQRYSRWHGAWSSITERRRTRNLLVPEGIVLKTILAMRFQVGECATEKCDPVTKCCSVVRLFAPIIIVNYPMATWIFQATVDEEFVPQRRVACPFEKIFPFDYPSEEEETPLGRFSIFWLSFLREILLRNQVFQGNMHPPAFLAWVYRLTTENFENSTVVFP